MVIVCPECSTKFRVNSERIPAAGAKVRCARCKHVFLAEKPVETIATQPVPEESPLLASEPEPTQPEPTQPEPTQPEPTEEAPARAETSADNNARDDSFDTSAAEDNDFNYDQFRDLDTAKSDDENFTFGDKEETEEPPAPEQDAVARDSFPQAEDVNEEEPFSFSSPTDEPASSGIEDAKAEPLETGAETGSDQEPQSETEIPAPATAEKKSSPASSLSRIFLLLILGLLIIGGTLYFINGPEQIEQIIQQILGQQTTQPAQPGQIAIVNLEGKFINNQESGELFVIRGEATNNFAEARASIQVKGVIFDQNGKPLLQKTIFCGNPISDQELQTLPFGKLEEMMGNQFGKAQKNMKINSKQTIPFVITFRDLPKDLSEFSVDVTSSEPAAQ